jgi:hypothetical protein
MGGRIMVKHKQAPLKNAMGGNYIVPSVITSQDVKELINYCQADISAFDKLGTRQGRNIFIPGNTKFDFNNKHRKVLAVAHLDHYKGKLSCTDTSLITPALDDRLGVWAICRKLPTMVNGGRRYDILLTVDEEHGLSSADEFCKQADKYNWIFELDRRGADAAYYGFCDDLWLEALQGDGWELSIGSFTDICAFEEGRVSAINFGIAYENEHTTNCRVDFSKLGLQLQRIAAFYNRYQNSRFAHDGMMYSYRYLRSGVKGASKYKNPYAWGTVDELNGVALQNRIWNEDSYGATVKNEITQQKVASEAPKVTPSKLKDWSYVPDTYKPNQPGGKS